MHQKLIHKLRQFSAQYNCNACYLKENHQCNENQRENCQMEQVGVEVIRRRPKTADAPEPNPVLCGQGRCQECREVLC